MIIVGIDLAGSIKRKTGICILNDKLIAKTSIVYTDDEIIGLVEKVKPDLIAIDAPLSIPYGRKSLDEESNIHFRECDKMLLEMGIKFFPITLGPMRMLTKRGIKLKNILEAKGYNVIEVYPGGAQDILGIPRKSHGLDRLKEGLERLGIRGIGEKVTGDELDAITAAYVGYLFLRKKALLLNGRDGCIVMPLYNLFK